MLNPLRGVQQILRESCPVLPAVRRSIERGLYSAVCVSRVVSHLCLRSVPLQLNHLQKVSVFRIMGKKQSKFDLPQPEPGTEPAAKDREGSSATDGAPQQSMSSDDCVVCNVEDLKDGEMKEVDVGSRKALLVREGSDFFAVGPKCSHYGASLVNGALCNGIVRCPWHGACFNVKTGDIEEFPGLDSIPKFDVSVKDGKVIVKKDPGVEGNKRVKTMTVSAADNKQTFVLVGGGAATVTCAETLRQEGFTGKIVIVTREKHLPYDRPKLSKAMSINVAEITLRDASFYEKYDIQIQKEKEVVSVDSDKKSITFSDGGSLQFDSLLLATGGKPRTLPIPGLELKNVCLLRTPDDANYIAENAKGKNVVIIGSSFIGMEVASFLADKAQSVSVVDLIKVPFQLTLGEKLGTVFHKMHEEKGVKFYFERSIKEFVGDDGKVTEAVLSDDTRIPADLCVLGIGVVPATDFLKDSGIAMTNRGFITVDKCLKTSSSHVFAAGDIVEFPLFTTGDAQANVQHWQMASQHGKTAAFNMLGKKRELKSVPYFWTVMYGKSVRYTGYGPGYDDVIIHGDLDAAKFVAFYTKGDDVVAVASLAFDPIVSQAAQLMAWGQVIKKSEIIDDPKSWVHRLQK